MLTAKKRLRLNQLEKKFANYEFLEYIKLVEESKFPSTRRKEMLPSADYILCAKDSFGVLINDIEKIMEN